MKIRTKCFLTVLITYLSMCLVSWCACHGLIITGTSPWWTIPVSAIIAIILSVVGVRLIEQPKSILLSFIITVIIGWFLALFLFFLFQGIMNTIDGFTTIVYFTAMIFGFPGYVFYMAISESLTSDAEILGRMLYFLCGLIPIFVTLVSVKIKKKH